MMNKNSVFFTDIDFSLSSCCPITWTAMAKKQFPAKKMESRGRSDEPRRVFHYTWDWTTMKSNKKTTSRLNLLTQLKFYIVNLRNMTVPQDQRRKAH